MAERNTAEEPERDVQKEKQAQQVTKIDLTDEEAIAIKREENIADPDGQQSTLQNPAAALFSAASTADHTSKDSGRDPT
jgi:hypothetical protein